ncbi:MAG: DEAD/DEAH box helicase family protein [Candidatus Acidiferrum sp.]
MATNDRIPDQRDIQARLKEADEECQRLREENDRLRTILGMDHLAPNETVERITSAGTPALIAPTETYTPERKIALYRSLFRGREDVFAIRWEGKGGKSGYSPAGAMDWRAIHAARPEDRKRVGRKTRILQPLTDEVIRNHLTGKQTIGIYPLLPDETCWLLAVDFDKNSWMADAAAFAATCRQFHVPAFIERSRSGNGAHVWIFFDRPVSGVDARRLGCALLTRTLEKRHEIGLDSYDRLFPSQDTIPKGGFGNLIALPLQKVPRDRGNTVFLDELLRPCADQWRFLESIQRIPVERLANIIREIAPGMNPVGVRFSFADGDEDEVPWHWSPSRKRAEASIGGPLPSIIHLVVSNLVYVERKDLPSGMVDRLVRVAAFQNPEFYRAQAMRLSTYGKPRVISCGEIFPEHVGLPRGCIEDVINVFKAHSVKLQVQDERTAGKKIDVHFQGELRPAQKDALAGVLVHDNGVLCAPTAFGKTVVAASLINVRAVNTLILVHRRQLMDQWRERLAAYLALPIADIGQFGGGKNTRTSLIDVAVIQSLQRRGAIEDFVADYGHVIVDECHHLSAVTFERVLREVKAKYVLGLTATPTRKDGHHPIIHMQCGPIRFHLSARKAAESAPFQHKVFPRLTSFAWKRPENETTIQDIYAALFSDQSRNDLIVRDLVKCLSSGRSPLVLTGRTEHLNYLAGRLQGICSHSFVMKGGMGVKQRRKLAESLAAVPLDEPRVILATGSYLGEGFDDSRLDTLFLVTPISWKGTLQQYVGRLHRLRENKSEVQVYDYADVSVPILVRMYKKRLAGYSAFGYTVEAGAEVDGNDSPSQRRDP